MKRRGHYVQSHSYALNLADRERRRRAVPLRPGMCDSTPFFTLGIWFVLGHSRIQNCPFLSHPQVFKRYLCKVPTYHRSLTQEIIAPF